MGQWICRDLLGKCNNADTVKIGGNQELYVQTGIGGRLERAIEDVSRAIQTVEELDRRQSPVPPQLKVGAAKAKELLGPARLALDGLRHPKCGEQLDCCDARTAACQQHFDELRQWQDQWVFDINDAQLALNVGKLGQQKSKGRDYEGALDVFSEALKKSPSDAFLLNQRGRVFMHRHQDKEALEDFRGVLKLNPGDAFALGFIHLMEAQEHYSLAETALKAWSRKDSDLSANENDNNSQEGANQDNGQTDVPEVDKDAAVSQQPDGTSRAEVDRSLQDTRQFLQKAHDALPSQEEGRDLDELRARIRVLRARVLLSQIPSEPMRALEELNAALALRPRTDEARALRSSVCEQLGMLELKRWNEAIEDDPSNTDALLGRSKLLMEQGQLHGALVDIDKALDSSGGLESLLASAETKQNLLRLPEALEDCFKAHDLEPENEEVMARINELRELMRNMEDASVTSEKSSVPLLGGDNGHRQNIRAALRGALRALRLQPRRRPSSS